MSKYIYDPESLRYEQADKNLKYRLIKIITGVSSMILALVIVIILSITTDSPEERELRQENRALSEDFNYLTQKYSNIDTVIRELKAIDEDIYRTIFEAEPIGEDIQNESGVDNYLGLLKLKNHKIIYTTRDGLADVLDHVRINAREYSYLKEHVYKRKEVLNSIPGIQPLKNQDLTRFASGYGNRLHPYYKIVKFHSGIDFTAPTGTPVIATADGIVEDIERTRRGKGNTVVINHENGYKTTYSHLGEFKVRRNQSIKRGEILGTVGNSGLSVAPHLHYEVLLNDENVNPVNYFFLELSPRDYDILIEMSVKSGQSFD